MPTIVKRTSPYRGVFVKRSHVIPSASAYAAYEDTIPDVRFGLLPNRHVKREMEKRRQARIKGEFVDSDFDGDVFPAGFRNDQFSSERNYKIEDYEALRRKTREERFVPAICRMSQQKKGLTRISTHIGQKARKARYVHNLKSPYLHKIALEEGDEDVSDVASSDEPESEVSSDSDDEEDLSVLERTPIDLTPPISPHDTTILGSPRTPTDPRVPPPRPPHSPSIAYPDISPLALPTTPPPPPCPAHKSLDDIFDENYATLMAITPVIPLHFRQQIQKWLQKLVSMSDSDKNKINRNQHLAFMLLQLQTLEMTTPFTKDPPPGPLKELGRNSTNSYFKKWLKEAKRVSVQDKIKRSCKPLEIAQRLTNEYPNDFLEHQPVPNFGMIAYGACFSSYGQ